MKVLLVEDDHLLGESVKEFLKENGCTVDWVWDPREVKDLLEVSIYDVIILDLMMPHLSGEEVLKEIRKKDQKVPVLVLTAKGRLEDKKVCFNLGADDYLTKPFEPEELLLRLKALVRRKLPSKQVEIGRLKVDLEEEKVWLDSKVLLLSRKEWLLLKYLVENRGRCVSSEELLNYVWGDEPVGEEVVRAHIKNLRKILPPDTIVTVKGRGYCIP
ncbi:two component transcriptional regulator, winged helix family [Thermocrinis albus DSM 14484]|uniref:Two component transcriptional regulator, winged helix family n=1 Tax=Thermocrinis albus (strain DSM 14484 / JCM 11386 / HI 11/12) TaxID=638303 RepID=D3SNQ4_THEAH|nr:response regulator transcription factor [Thermocrinis albus]ADC88791.1 two component transcriptional regulator, winged helix family [Thermocrinis albus DSM 14484]